MGQVANYSGTIADCNLLSTEGSYPTDVQLDDAIDYWWSGSRLRMVCSQPLVVSTFASESTRKQQLILAENTHKVLSLVVAWYRAVESKAHATRKFDM